MPTYELRHYGPRGQHKQTFTPDTARATGGFSVRVDGHGDCKNGVINQFTKGFGVRAGDWLEVWMDDGSGGGLAPRYAGEVRIANGEEFTEASDLNLAGGMARLGKVEVRLGRVPDAGDADTGEIARAAVGACLPQTGGALSTDLSQILNSGDVTALTPYYAPLAEALKGLTALTPGWGCGVDATRRVFLRQGNGELRLNEADPRITVEARKVSGEGLCTAVRWMLGTGDDGHPLTHLSSDPTLTAIWGEHVYQAQLTDGISWLRRLPAEALSFRLRGGSARSLRNGSATPALDYGVLTDADPASRLVITQTGDLMPGLDVYATGRAIDAVKLSATSTAARVSNVNDFEPIGASAVGGKGLHGLFTSWQGAVTVLAGGRREDGAAVTLEIATLEPMEIDRAALDRRAARLYRVPAENPVSISVHGLWLAPAPTVRLERTNGTVLTERVSELEYVDRNGWWGTVIHVQQREDGEQEAVSEAIRERDREAGLSTARAAEQLSGVRGTV